MKSKKIFNNGLKGIGLMIAGQLSFAINDSYVKLSVLDLNSNISTFNVIFIRGVVTSLLILLYIILVEKKKIKKTLFNKNYHIRGFFEVLTAIFFFAGLILMPISTVYTFLMTNPFFVTIFAFIFLKEKVGFKRWTAVLVGFVGVIIVVNPSSMKFGYLFILPIMAAIFLTIRDIITKGFVNKSNSFEIIFITSILMTFFSGVTSLFLGFDITLKQIPYILISSFFLIFGYLFSVMTIFYAPLSLTASARYTVIIFGIIFGYLIIGETPSINMIIGAVIISLSGLFVINRQKKLGKID